MRMSETGDFLQQGFRQAELELVDIVGSANLHLKPETVTRSLRARVRARLKALETILRRLILLMAMALDLAPVKPQAARAAAPLPEGVEDVTASFRAHLTLYNMALMPGATVRLETGPVRPFPDSSRTFSGPFPAAPLLARASALFRLLKAPEAAARRMARLLDRMKRRGEGRPWCLPMTRRHLMAPELALLAGVLPGLVNTALEAWADTG